MKYSALGIDTVGQTVRTGQPPVHENGNSGARVALLCASGDNMPRACGCPLSNASPVPLQHPIRTGALLASK